MNERTTQYLIYAAIAVTATVAGLSLGGVFDTAVMKPAWNKVLTESALTPSCNVQIVRLEGSLSTYPNALPSDPTDPNGGGYDRSIDSETIVSEIETANSSPEIKAIILQIDSNGGSPVAGEEIANALKRSPKPTVALIRGGGLSAAYWSATGADTIIAAANAEVGSIGVTSSYLDQTKHNSQSGYTWNGISTGEYKDMLNSNKSLTPKERDIVAHELGIIFANFVRTVNENRHLAIEASSSELTTGVAFIAPEALEKRLIDKIGDKETAREYLSGALSLPRDQVTFCE